MAVKHTIEKWQTGYLLRWKTSIMPYFATIVFETLEEAEYVAKRLEDRLEGRADPPPQSKRCVVCMSCEERIPTLEALDIALDLEIARVGYEMGMGPICKSCSMTRWGVMADFWGK